MPTTTAQLEDTIEQLHAVECAVRAEFLSALAEYARTEAFRDDGARDLAEWLTARLSMSGYQARETARVAEALTDLPEIHAAYAEGRLSFDQLRALTRYATPATDAALAEEAPGLSLRAVEKAARRARRKSTDEAEKEHADQFLSLYRRGENRLAIRGELNGDWAAVVEKALLRTLERQPRPREGEAAEPYDFRVAAALYELCSGAVGADPDPDRATVVLHTEVDALGADDAVADLEGFLVNSETARRLSCDGRIQEILEFGGVPVGLGRTTRTVSPALARLLRDRDEGCRFPGCSRRRWVHAHHMVHWARGGPTDVGNLLLLCSYHHHFVHEGGWSIRGNPAGEVEFRRPDGTAYASRLPGLRPQLAAWLRGNAA